MSRNEKVLENKVFRKLQIIQKWSRWKVIEIIFKGLDGDLSFHNQDNETFDDSFTLRYLSTIYKRLQVGNSVSNNYIISNVKSIRSIKYSKYYSKDIHSFVFNVQVIETSKLKRPVH